MFERVIAVGVMNASVLVMFVWHIVVMVQMFLGYGTAYRLTRSGGDNGVALFGWFFVMGLASLVPGLGIYLWFRHRDT